MATNTKASKLETANNNCESLWSSISVRTKVAIIFALGFETFIPCLLSCSHLMPWFLLKPDPLAPWLLNSQPRTPGKRLSARSLDLHCRSRSLPRLRLQDRQCQWKRSSLRERMRSALRRGSPHLHLLPERPPLLYPSRTPTKSVRALASWREEVRHRYVFKT